MQGKATWKDGMWRVVMRRPLSSEEQENEARLDSGTYPGGLLCRVEWRKQGAQWPKSHGALVSTLA